ncbi:MAG: hypothetical protein Q8S31_08900 [Alphaproteobacteria bacterium]|nr:hypothetical protein [Alphaproteobacteria bacterium]
MKKKLFLRTTFSLLTFLTLMHQNSEAAIYEISPTNTIKIEDTSSSSSSNISEKYSLYETIKEFAPIEMDWEFINNIRDNKITVYNNYIYTSNSDLKGVTSSNYENIQFVKAIYNDENDLMELTYQLNPVNTWTTWASSFIVANPPIQIVVNVNLDNHDSNLPIKKLKFLAGKENAYLDIASYMLQQDVELYLNALLSKINENKQSIFTTQMQDGLETKINNAKITILNYIDQIKNRSPVEILDIHKYIHDELKNAIGFFMDLFESESNLTHSAFLPTDRSKAKATSSDEESPEDSNASSLDVNHDPVARDSEMEHLESFVKNERIPLPETPKASKFKNTKKISGNELFEKQKAGVANLEEKRVEEILKKFLTLEKIDQTFTTEED